MARQVVLAGAEPVNDGERIVVAALTEGLPDGYVVMPNIEIVERGGRRLEYDVIVAAPHAVYVIETKALLGSVVGDDREWRIDGSTRPAPIRLTTHKAKVLKGFLADELPLLSGAWVEPAVVLAVPPRSLDLEGSARIHTFDPDGLLRFIQSPGRLPFSPRRIDRLADRVADILGGRAAARGQPAAFGQWEVVEALQADDVATEYRAVHRFARHAPPARLRVVSLSPYAFSPQELEQRRRVVAREFAALRTMGAHPNIVAAIDVFEDDHGNAVVVTEEVPGTSLGIALRDHEVITDEQRITVLEGLARALEHAHERGVVHRSVNPENLILNEDGAAVLTGFGSAHIVTEGTIYLSRSLDEMPKGFAAPELLEASNQPVGPATDLFGLACIACALWAGGPPPTGPAGVAALDGSEGLPAWLVPVMGTWVARDPRERTGGPADLLAAIDAERSDQGSAEGRGRTDAAGRSSPAAERERAPLAYAEGDVIEDRYECIEILGSGAFSTVYRATDSVLEMECALKLYSPQYGLEAMQREIRALRRIDHPHVVHVIDAGRTGTQPRQWYLKSEYVDGTSLEPLTEPGGEHLSVDRAVELADQLLDALVAIHPDAERIAALEATDEMTEEEFDELQRLKTEGIVHRDIKPQNLMITSAGQLKLLDFNIATPVGARVDTVGGTPGYEPPDADFTRWDVSTDLFATGVVFYELLSQHHPYVERNTFGDGPIPLREVAPDVPEPLAIFVERACAPERDVRFATAVEMRQALASAMGRRPAPAEEYPTLPAPHVEELDGDFRGATIGLQTLPSGHHHIGWLSTPDIRLPLVVADAPAETPLVGVLSAIAPGGGERYAGVRGGHLWASDGSAVTFAATVGASWRLGDASVGEEPVAEQITEQSWRFYWRDVDLGALGECDLEATVEDQGGLAFVLLEARRSSVAAASSGVDEIEVFLQSRSNGSDAHLGIVREFLDAARSRGDVEVEIGRSSLNPDGHNNYVMLRRKGPQQFGAVAYLWPRNRRLKWRLPVAAAEGRPGVQPRSGKNASAYQVGSSLSDQESLDLALELLDQALEQIAPDRQEQGSADLGGSPSPVTPEVRHRSARSGSPVRIISVDGRNNVTIDIPAALFAANGLRPLDHDPVAGFAPSGRDLVRVKLGAAAGRYLADLAGLTALPTRLPAMIPGVADDLVAAVPVAAARVARLQARGERPVAAIYVQDLARVTGADPSEIKARYSASST